MYVRVASECYFCMSLSLHLYNPNFTRLQGLISDSSLSPLSLHQYISYDVKKKGCFHHLRAFSCFIRCQTCCSHTLILPYGSHLWSQRCCSRFLPSNETVSCLGGAALNNSTEPLLAALWYKKTSEPFTCHVPLSGCGITD